MRIGIFVVMAGRQAGGPETYEHGLLRALAEIDHVNEYHVFCLNPGAPESFGLKQDNVFFHVLRPAIRWISLPTVLPLALLHNRIDFLHATFVPPPWCPTQYAFTVHGVDMFAHPEFYPAIVRWRLNSLIRTGLRKAKVVLCVSNTVKRIIAEQFNIPTDRLVVSYNAVGSHFRPLDRATVSCTLQQKYAISGPYVLYVGKLQACKNIVRIIEAFHRFRCESRTDFKLVLVGRRTWTSEGIDEALERLQLQQHVMELGYIPHEDLPLLYNGASMFIFPSLSEGFGMPVLEAMACGTPVITSSVDALPEVTDGAALYTDPYSVDEIAGAMHRLHVEPQTAARLRHLGLERVKTFTWQRAAEQTLAAYKQMVS